MEVRTSDASFIALATSFFGDERYRVVGDAVARKRPIFSFLFTLVAVFSRVRFGNAILMASAILGYGSIRRPARAPLFQFGLSANNKRIFRRLNAAAMRPEWDRLINGEHLSIADRLAVLVRFRALWKMAGVLTKSRAESPFVQTQLVLAGTGWLVFRYEKFEGVRCVCIASDHSPITMALLRAAREKGLRTCYAQHAPVADHFPPLDYDLAVLFDRASAAIYNRAADRRNSESKAQVLILPPFDSDAISPCVVSPPFRIGLCLSYLFDTDGLVQLLRALLRHDHVAAIRVRRHPRCRADLRVLLVDERVTEVSPGSLAEFADECDIALVPNSGVAIELLHLGKPVMYTPGVDFVEYDYYGFVEAGIIPVFKLEALQTPERLLSFFNADWRKRYACFDETVQEPLRVSQDRVGRAFEALVQGVATKDKQGHGC